MKRRIRALTVALALMVPPLAAGPINTHGHAGISRTATATTHGLEAINAGASFKVESAKDGILLRDGTKESLTMLSQSIFFAFGIGNYADLAVEIPYYQDIWDGHESKNHGLGDLSFGVKLLHPGLVDDAPLRVGYMLNFRVPTGEENRGYFQRHSYFTNREGSEGNDAFTGGAYYISPSILWSLDFSNIANNRPWMLHANLGAAICLYTPNKEILQSDYSAILGSLLLQYNHTDMLTFFTELNGEFRVSQFTTGDFKMKYFGNDRVTWSLGAETLRESGLFFGGSFDLGVSRDYYTTEWRKRDDTGTPFSYRTKPVPKAGLTFTAGFRRAGKDRPAIPSRVVEFDTVTTVVTDTIFMIQQDTVVIKERDTIKVIDTLIISNREELKIINGESITLTEVTFQPGSSRLHPSSLSSLNTIVESLQNLSDVRVSINGYTDNTGNPEQNRELSRQRAQSVADYLISRGISEERLKVVGRGIENPIASNNTVNGRRLNRRVEIERI